MASYFTYTFLVVALAFNAANALDCYSCNSKDSVACRWGLTSFTYNVETCTSVGFLDSLVGPKCYKITAKNSEGGEYIARGCQNPPALGCEALAKTVGWISDQSSNDPDRITDINCVTCESDKCNSATKIAGLSLLGLLVATFAFLF